MAAIMALTASWSATSAWYALAWPPAWRMAATVASASAFDRE
jgi:hypothetical protein